MIRVVVDTNVIASGFGPTHGSPEAILDAWRAGQYALVTSEPLLDEVQRTLGKPYFRQRLSEADVQDIMRLLRNDGLFTQLTVEVQGIATHPEDDLILATAVSAQADYLVTGDHHLQRLGSYQGVEILSPQAFLERLREREHQLEQERAREIEQDDELELG